MAKPNLRDQQLQSVLYLLNAPLGPEGIDGNRGKNTTLAMTSAAVRIGVFSKDAQEMQNNLIKKLEDPGFRDAAMQKLKAIDPPTKDSIIAMQTVLMAGDFGNKAMLDKNGMVNGKMNEATRVAIADYDSGKPSGFSYADAGGKISPTQAAVFAGGASLQDKFSPAASGEAVAVAAPLLVNKVALANDFTR